MYNADAKKKAELYANLFISGVLTAILWDRPIEVYSYTEQKWLDCPNPNFGILPWNCYRVKDDV